MNRRRGSGTQSYLVDLLAVATISSFAFAQPIYDLLSRNAEFFVARQAERTDILVLVAVLSFLLPAALASIELLARAFSARLRQSVHTLLLAALLAIALLPIIKRVTGPPGETALAAGILAGSLGAIAYIRWAHVRTFLTFLAPAILLFPTIFLFSGSISKLVQRSVSGDGGPLQRYTDASIVFVVLDELPLLSLLDGSSRIDPVRFPNFAALASRSTWYRNAVTVDSSTVRSLPAILSGLYPDRSRLATSADYPQNLFTLLGRSYAMNVVESHTMMCPPEVCESVWQRPGFAERNRALFSDVSIAYLHTLLPTDLTSSLPSVTQTWRNFRGGAAGSETAAADPKEIHAQAVRSYSDRPGIFGDFVGAIQPENPPALSFIHTMLPHVPWSYLPSGKRYAHGSKIEIPGLDLSREIWGTNELLVTQAYRRHLLQVRFVDRLIGRLVEHLKGQELFDSSLIIVTADHGVSFWPGAPRRAAAGPHSADILRVPLFIKHPHQAQGVIRDHLARTIDILPTVADLLGLEFPIPVDGRSLEVDEIICSGRSAIPVIRRVRGSQVAGIELDEGKARIVASVTVPKDSEPPHILIACSQDDCLKATQLLGSPSSADRAGSPDGSHKAGFEIMLSKRAVDNLEAFGLRFFSITEGGLASELSYGNENPWKPRFPRTRSIARATAVEPLCVDRSGRSGEASYSLQAFVRDENPVSHQSRPEGADLDALVESESFYRKLELFGSGERARGDFATGPHSDLLGVQPVELASGDGSVSVRLEQSELFENIDPDGEFLPAMINGALVKSRGGRIDLAIVVNGTIQAITHSFQDEDGTSRFSALVPEASFQAGRNEIQVLTIDSGSEPRLRVLYDSLHAGGS